MSIDLGFDFPLWKELTGAVAGVGTFAYSCYKIGRRVGSSADKSLIVALKTQIEEGDVGRAQLDERIKRLDDTVKDARNFWFRAPEPATLAAHQAALSSSIPVICVVNFKGGVGKTTICANLAGYFAQRGKRVLLVDCDYQGSLSDTVLTQARVENFRAIAHKLMEGGHEPAQLRMEAERLSSIDSRLWIYPAFYDFSRAEIQMMFRWLVGSEPEIRYNMAHYLQANAFQRDEETRFDIVLIDAPPRLLTGAVNALVASTHVLIPTILDGQSHTATLNTVTAIDQFRRKLNPGLRLLGIVPSLVTTSTGFNEREEHFIAELERKLPEHYDGVLPILKTKAIAKREELAKAGGSEILYSGTATNAGAKAAREMFAKLGEHIHDTVRWRTGEPEGEVIAMPGQSKRRVSG